MLLLARNDNRSSTARVGQYASGDGEQEGDATTDNDSCEQAEQKASDDDQQHDDDGEQVDSGDGEQIDSGDDDDQEENAQDTLLLQQQPLFAPLALAPTTTPPG